MQHAPFRVLFVDDNDDIRSLIKEWLSIFNCEVATAESIASALASAQSATFDIYVLDAQLSDGTGAELCKKIREFDGMTPIIFYSGETLGRLQSALACGAQGCVMKPGLDGLQKAIFRAVNTVAA